MNSNIDYQFLGKILEKILPGISIADGNGIFVYLSESCMRMFSIDADEFLGKRADNPEICDYFKPCVTQMVYESGRKIVTTQQTKSGETILVTGVPVFNDNHELEMILVNSTWEIGTHDELKEKYNTLRKENAQLEIQLTKLIQKNQQDSNIVSKSQLIQDCIRIISIFSSRNLPVFICGERGSGKKYLIRNVYGKNKPLFEYNCTLMAESIMEEEFFGDNGFFASDNLSTVIFENVEGLPLLLQQKLLTFIKNDKKAIILTSKYSLDELLNQGKITSDFYNYFRSYQIKIPPIRERRQDLSLFLTFYLKHFNNLYDRNISLSPRAFEALLNYHWPGNINEIKSTIERLVLTAEHERVDAYQLPKEFSNRSYAFFTSENSLRDMMDLYEGHIIRNAFEKFGTTVAVSKYLKISQTSASRKRQKYIDACNEH